MPLAPLLIKHKSTEPYYTRTVYTGPPPIEPTATQPDYTTYISQCTYTQGRQENLHIQTSQIDI